jgi:hypothetical protein
MGFQNYGNVNVKAYTESMGFTNFSNVNVAAYTQTQSYTNYSNVNVVAYLAGNITTGNITTAGTITVNPGTGGNTIISKGNLYIDGAPGILRISSGYTGGFQIDGSGPRLGLGTLANTFAFFDVYAINNNTYINSSSRPLYIGFSTGGAGGNVLYMDPRWGNTVLNTNVASISTTTGAFVVTGGVGIGGNLNVGGNLTVAGISGNLNVGGNISAENINFTGNIIHADSGDPVGYVYSIDDISSQFDGSQVVFTISVNDGTIYSVNNPNQISLQIGGVSVAPTRYIRDYFNLSGVSVFNRGFYLQTGNIEANASIITGNNFSTGGNTIVFATAPSAGMSFYGTVRTNSDPIAQFTFKQSPFTALNIMLGS